MAAVIFIRRYIDALDCTRCIPIRSFCGIDIISVALILADAVGALVDNRIQRFYRFARKPATAAIVRVRTFDIRADISVGRRAKDFACRRT